MRVLLIVLACLVVVSYQRSLKTVQTNEEAAAGQRSVDDESGRFFLGWKYLFGYNYLTYTITSYVSITTMLTSLSITRCIPASLFMNAAAQASSCRRRRREIKDITFDDDDEADSISPSIVDQLKVSELPPSMSEVRRLEAPEILSSQDDGVIPAPAVGRSARNLYQYVVTVTSTTISYSVTTTTWKTTAVMAASSTILCMPYGYSLC